MEKVPKADFYKTVYLKVDIVSTDAYAIVLIISLNILTQLLSWMSVKQKAIQRVCKLLHSARLFLGLGW